MKPTGKLWSGVGDRAGDATRTVDEHLAIRPVDAAHHVSSDRVEVADRTIESETIHTAAHTA